MALRVCFIFVTDSGEICVDMLSFQPIELGCLVDFWVFFLNNFYL